MTGFQGHPAFSSRECRNGRHGYANIADDGHFQIGEIFFVVPDRVHVEQALCGVGMSAVTGIDDVNVIQLVLIQVAGDQKRRSGLVVTHNEHVGAHRGQVIDRIPAAFPPCWYWMPQCSG